MQPVPRLVHASGQCIAWELQLTVENVELVCRVTKPCKRESLKPSPCPVTTATHPRDTTGYSPVLASLSPGESTVWGQGCM